MVSKYNSSLSLSFTLSIVVHKYNDYYLNKYLIICQIILSSNQVFFNSNLAFSPHLYNMFSSEWREKMF